MPPRRYSRFAFTQTLTHENGAVYLTDREPYRYRPLSDTIEHIVREGDTLYALAHHHYQGLPRPAGLWWIIADFQPVPIHDPTVALTTGSTLYIPSLRTVQSDVFSESRRDEFTA